MTDRIPTRHDRRGSILQMIGEEGFCTISELARRFDVSEMTVRRDVVRLDDEGRVRIVHGGVTSLPLVQLAGSDFSLRASARSETKRRLAAEAAQFIPANGIMAIDAGTTTAEIARFLPSDRPLKVITHSLPVLNELADADNVETIALGGVFHPISRSYSGPMTTRALSDLSIGTTFLGASGVNDRGVFCGNDYDAVIKRALIEVSDEVVLVCDSEKFSATAMARVCAVSNIDRIIVDGGITPRDRQILENAGVLVITVGESDAAQ